MNTRILYILISLAMPASLAMARAGNHQISGFRYLTCGKSECVEIRSAEAFISAASGGFSTKGPTELRILTLAGDVKALEQGHHGSLNPTLRVLTLDQDGDAFLLYSLKDQTLTRFDAKAKSP